MATKKEKSAERFLWLGQACYWQGPGDGFRLEHGQVYQSRLVDADVLAEWIRAGAAQMVEDKEK